MAKQTVKTTKTTVVKVRTKPGSKGVKVKK